MRNEPFKSVTTVVGGGNSAHSLIPLLADGGHKVNLLTRRPALWSPVVGMEYLLSTGEIKDTLYGRPDRITDQPASVIPESDIIILSLPVAKCRIVLDRIAPYINPSKTTYIGTIYGQAGFNWMVEEVKKKYDLKNIVTFACGEIPWNNRTREYGKTGLNYGPKAVNVAAVNPPEAFDFLNKTLFDDLSFTWFKKGKFWQAENFISLTLSVDNQIIHLSRLYGLYLKSGGKWQRKPDVPFFYRDYDDLSADLLRDIDEEYTRIRQRIITKFPSKRFTYMLNYLDLERLCNNSANTDIKESFVTSKTLWHIETPTIQNENGEWTFDREHRFFTDDLYYGLVIAKWIGEKLDIETPTIDSIIKWAQEFIGDRIIDGKKLIQSGNNPANVYKSGIPTVYGFENIEDIID